MNLLKRYNDAYLVARALDGAGDGIKITGFVLAALVGIGAGYVGNEINTSLGVAGILMGAVLAFPFYVLGVLISAQGQILKATLDTAVNTSPLLTQDEVRSILAVDSGGDLPGSLAPGSTTLSSAPDRSAATRLCPACGALHPANAFDCSCGHKFTAANPGS